MNKRQFLTLLIVIIAATVALFVADMVDSQLHYARWFCVCLTVVFFLVFFVVGYFVTGYGGGILIDSRNRMSLSRLQIVGWSSLAFGGLCTAILNNWLISKGDHLDITFPEELLWLMGISLGSTVASPITQVFKRNRKIAKEEKDKIEAPAREAIRSVINLKTQALVEILQQRKSNRMDTEREVTRILKGSIENDQHRERIEIYADQVARYLVYELPQAEIDMLVGDEQEKVVKKVLDNTSSLAQKNREGSLFVNPSPANARWSDIFRSEEINKQEKVDPGKVQMAIFTVVLQLGYLLALFNTFSDSGIMIDNLPELSSSLVILLAISHGGYLGNKLVPQTQAGSTANGTSQNE